MSKCNIVNFTVVYGYRGFSSHPQLQMGHIMRQAQCYHTGLTNPVLHCTTFVIITQLQHLCLSLFVLLTLCSPLSESTCHQRVAHPVRSWEVFKLCVFLFRKYLQRHLLDSPTNAQNSYHIIFSRGGSAIQRKKIYKETLEKISSASAVISLLEHGSVHVTRIPLGAIPVSVESDEEESYVPFI